MAVFARLWGSPLIRPDHFGYFTVDQSCSGFHCVPIREAVLDLLRRKDPHWDCHSDLRRGIPGESLGIPTFAEYVHGGDCARTPPQEGWDIPVKQIQDRNRKPTDAGFLPMGLFDRLLQRNNRPLSKVPLFRYHRMRNRFKNTNVCMTRYQNSIRNNSGERPE